MLKRLFWLGLLCLPALANDAVVRLRYERQYQGESITGHGTAFAIGKRTLLTATHNVFDSWKSGKFYDALRIEVKGDWIACRVKASDEYSDVCLLETDTDMSALKLAADELKTGESLSLDASARGEHVKRYAGRLTRKFKSGLAWHEMKIEFDHGMSGGPVLNVAGEVIGMAVAGTPKNGDLDHESGLYVPVVVIRAFLEELR
jgi:hypothetical protein